MKLKMTKQTQSNLNRNFFPLALEEPEKFFIILQQGFESEGFFWTEEPFRHIYILRTEDKPSPYDEGITEFEKHSRKINNNMWFGLAKCMAFWWHIKEQKNIESIVIVQTNDEFLVSSLKEENEPLLIFLPQTNEFELISEKDEVDESRYTTHRYIVKIQLINK
jgi:hypothetical protein